MTVEVFQNGYNFEIVPCSKCTRNFLGYIKELIKRRTGTLRTGSVESGSLRVKPVLQLGEMRVVGSLE